MNTTVDKTPNKKRKSLGVLNKTPAKAAKIDESVPSPKNAKSPKVDSKPVANNVVSNNATPKNVAQAKSPKKQIKPENGVGPKLNKFKGTKSLEDNKATLDKKLKKQQKKKEKRKKATNSAKKDFLFEKLNKRVEKEGKEAVIKSLNEKIDAIVSRSDLSKTGKRTLRNYKHLLQKLSGEELVATASKPANKATKNKKKNEKQTTNNTAAAIPKEIKLKQGKKTDQKVEEKKGAASKQKVVEKEDDEEDSDYDVETSFKDVKNAEFEDDSGEDEEETDDEDEEESDDDDDDDSGEDDDEEEDEEEKPTKKAQPKKVIETKNAKPQQQNNENSQQKTQKKSRYVLFIGNIAYDTTREELKEHFKKVGEVIDVRIPTDKENNRPRGFAYVELADEAAYQKSLDLNGSQLKNRKIKVEYTQGGNKNGEDKKREIKSKNFKLHAMRNQGKGSPFKGPRGSPNKGPNRGSPFKK